MFRSHSAILVDRHCCCYILPGINVSLFVQGFKVCLECRGPILFLLKIAYFNLQKGIQIAWNKSFKFLHLHWPMFDTTVRKNIALAVTSGIYRYLSLILVFLWYISALFSDIISLLSVHMCITFSMWHLQALGCKMFWLLFCSIASFKRNKC